MNSRLRFSWILRSIFVGLLASNPLTAVAGELPGGSAQGSMPGTLSPLIQDINQTSGNTNIDAPIVAPGALPPVIQDVNDTSESEAQVSAVSQLSDVQPTDWAFQALQSLVERYGCIAGYPNSTFRGDRAVTRYELAAALNACLDQISDKFATKEDLAAVKALQEEFKAELATLKGKVDSLEARTTTLEAQSFATTTKLSGEVVWMAGEVFSDGKASAFGNGGGDRVDGNSEFFFGDRARLNFDTSFSGKDRLRVRLQARNIVPLDSGTSSPTGTNMTRLSVDGDNNNTFELDDLWYRFPIGSKGLLNVIAKSGEFNDFVGTTFNPYFESSGSGALSRFGRFNPIYRFGDSSIPATYPGAGSSSAAGAVFTYKFNPTYGISAGFLADLPNFTVPSNLTGAKTGGLFGGSYAALAQIEVSPTPFLNLGLTYVHAFQEDGLVSLNGGTGSSFARRPFNFGANQALIADNAGLEFNWKVNPHLNISGWGGITFAEDARSAETATTVNWALAFAFPDLFKQGNVGGLIIGQQPRVVGGSVKSGSGFLNCNAFPGADEGNFAPECDPNFHIEALYKIRINGNIQITPGLIVILNPENNAGNPAQFVPLVRTTFKF